MPNMKSIVGQCDIAFIVLDTLRYDVAQHLHKTGQTPRISQYLADGWTKCYTPGNFTYASHQAFFAGFLPTPVTPGLHERLFAPAFAGSETTTKNTYCFDTPDIVTGLARIGYFTFCIGGVGFFSKSTALGSALPNLFQESYWSRETGVTNPDSTKVQVDVIQEKLHRRSDTENIFLFLNVSALHQPNYFYLPNKKSKKDTIDSHAAALKYVDNELGRLFDFLQSRRDTFVIICSDHGTAYGEEGFCGHRNSLPVVMEVPYAHFMLENTSL